MNSTHSLVDWLADEVLRLRLLIAALEAEKALREQRSPSVDVDTEAALRYLRQAG